MQAHQELIAPMDAVELRRAMEMQAAKVRLRFEADLSNTILDDIRDEPDAMPLLQHTLLELWKRRHGRWLRAEEYRNIGGVQQAIARTAEEVYAQLLPEERDRVRDIFVRLTRLDEDAVQGEERRDTRRRVMLEELVPVGDDLAVTVIFVLAAVAVFAMYQRNTAEEQRQIAEEQRQYAEKQRQIALARQLAAQAEIVRSQQADLLPRSVLLAIEAMRRFPSLEADQALRHGLPLLAHSTASMTHENNVKAIVFSPDGQYLATASADRTACVWEVSSGSEVQRIAYEKGAGAIAFSPDGKYLALAGTTDAYAIQVWEVLSGRTVSLIKHRDSKRLLPVSRHPAWAIAFSPDGKYLATASSGDTARVWETVTGQEIARMQHEESVSSVAFSPDGKYVATASEDRTARVWKAVSGREVARMEHSGAALTVAFSPDGKYLATASFDQTTQVWLWRPEDLITAVCNRLTRNLSRQEWNQFIVADIPYERTCPNLPPGRGVPPDTFTTQPK